MATPKVRVELTSAWAEITGAANTPGVTWQNVGAQNVLIAFSTAEPASSDVYHVLGPKQAYYDKSGSPKIWARTDGGVSILMATEE